MHVTFPADEGMDPMTDLSVPIHIVDDEINEADGQLFDAHLEVVNTIIIPTIKPSALCVLLDNDREC